MGVVGKVAHILSSVLKFFMIFMSCHNGIHYFAAGHHATERGGVQALAQHLTDKFGLDCEFVDLDNPA